MREEPELITANGLKHLERRLSDLEANLARIRRGKGRAALDGNVWHDNFAFEDLERQERSLLHQIAAIRERIARAVPVEITHDERKVSVGSKVDVELADGEALTLIIATDPESDPRAGIISYRAPLAQAILGVTAGETRRYQVGTKEHSVKVVRIRGKE